MGAEQIVNVRCWFVVAVLTWCGAFALRAATETTVAFDAANKLYEQGKFAEALIAYQTLAASNPSIASLWFNMGNAAYKAGQLGRAIASYRMAERLTPRDESLRANLDFVRGKIYSDERTHVPIWKSAVRRATLNEWTALTAIFFWATCFVLGCGEVTRRHYPKTALLFLVATLCSSVALTAAIRDQRANTEAVIIAREVTARFGPLDDSQSKFQLRDGAELEVLTVKDKWIEIRDVEKRIGWMRREDAAVLPGVVLR
jgi:tetratricopeptide (TPR) repeat protein